MKYRSEFKHGFSNRGCLQYAFLKALHGFQEKRAHKSRDMQCFLQNFQNEIFKILKMFKHNMKFTRAACWIKSKISNKKHGTHDILILSVLLIIIMVSLLQVFKVWFSLSKKLFYLLQWKPFKNNEKCFLFRLKSSPYSQDV